MILVNNIANISDILTVLPEYETLIISLKSLEQ